MQNEKNPWWAYLLVVRDRRNMNAWHQPSIISPHLTPSAFSASQAFCCPSRPQVNPAKASESSWGGPHPIILQLHLSYSKHQHQPRSHPHHFLLEYGKTTPPCTFTLAMFSEIYCLHYINKPWSTPAEWQQGQHEGRGHVNRNGESKLQ